MGLLGGWYVAVLAGADADLQEALEEARVVVLATVPFAFLAGRCAAASPAHRR